MTFVSPKDVLIYRADFGVLEATEDYTSHISLSVLRASGVCGVR